MMKHTPNYKKNSPLKTPTPFIKPNGKNKSHIHLSSKLQTSTTKYSVKARSSEKKKLALKRQITSQASKKLNYKGRNLGMSKKSTTPFKSGSIVRKLKQNSPSFLKKNLIQNMVSDKLNSVDNMRVRVSPKEPKVHTYSKYKRVRLLTSNKDSKNTWNSQNSSERNRSNYSSSYIPKYRENG